MPSDTASELEECSPASREGVLRGLPEVSEVLAATCRHVKSQRSVTRMDAEKRWEQASSSELVKAEEDLRKILSRELASNPEEPVPISQRIVWDLFSRWVGALGLATEKIEISVLQACTLEAHFWKKFRAQPSELTLHELLERGAGILDEWKRAGRFQDAQRAFNALWELEWPTEDSRPFAHFWQTGDFRRVSPHPEPGLRVLPVPIPVAGSEEEEVGSTEETDHFELLPRDVVQRLRRELPAVAKEAQAAARYLGRGDGHAGDAFPGIAAGGVWTKLQLYAVATGWREDLCSGLFVHLCALLRGSLYSESEEGSRAFKEGIMHQDDDVVILFGVSAGGWAPIHRGADRRINMHFCLSNCNGSRITVAGKTLQYQDEGLLAFEDRADHEILNDDPPGTEDRLNLVIGVPHPDLRGSYGGAPAAGSRGAGGLRSRGGRLEWLLQRIQESVSPVPTVLHEAADLAVRYSEKEALEVLRRIDLQLQVPGARGVPPLHNAAMSGDVKLMEFLLEQRADLHGLSVGQPLHYAAASGAMEAVKFLLRRGAREGAPDEQGETPQQWAESHGQTSMAEYLGKVVVAREKKRKEKQKRRRQSAAEAKQQEL